MKKSINKAEPVRFQRKHNYNILLINKVSNYRSLISLSVEDREITQMYFNPAKRQEGIEIILPFNDKKDIRVYNYLGERAIKKIRSEIRMDFNFEFWKYLREHLKKGEERKIIIDRFMDKFDLSEDDINSESLYRHSSRLLQDLN